MFSKLCDELGSEQSSLLLHTEVRWLSRGKTVEPVCGVREVLSIFLQERNADFASFVADEIWLGNLAYLAYMFNLPNQLNLSLQGRDANILLGQNKITLFIKKLNIWQHRINDIVDMFPVRCDFSANKPLTQN